MHPKDNISLRNVCIRTVGPVRVLSFFQTQKAQKEINNPFVLYVPFVAKTG